MTPTLPSMQLRELQALGERIVQFRVNFAVVDARAQIAILLNAGVFDSDAQEIIGVARRVLEAKQYREQLEERFGASRALVRTLTARAKRTLQRLVFPDGHDHRVLRAAHVLAEESVAAPILIGESELIRRAAAEAEVPLAGLTIVDPDSDAAKGRYARALWERRRLKGMTEHHALER